MLPDDIFVSIGRSIGAEVNCALQFLQDVSCGGNFKQFLVVGLNSCNFSDNLSSAAYCKLNNPSRSCEHLIFASIYF